MSQSPTADTPESDGPRADSPKMSEGYGMGSQAGAQHRSWSSAVAALHAGRSWWVSTTRADGRPHAMPVWGVAADQRLIFSTDPGSVKGRNMEAQGQAVVHLESGDDVVIVEATVTRIAPDLLPETFLVDYQAKYNMELDLTRPEYGWYELTPTKAFAWDEHEFTETAVRWRF